MTDSVFDFRGVEPALLRYRIVALIVSVLLVILFFVGLPLQFAAGHGQVDAIVGTVHGVFFYPLYIILTFDLGRRVRMHPVQVLLTAAAGTIPLASFYAERRTTRYMRERETALELA